MIGDLESCHWFADMFCVTHNQPEKECRKKAVDEWDQLRLKHESLISYYVEGLAKHGFILHPGLTPEQNAAEWAAKVQETNRLINEVIAAAKKFEGRVGPELLRKLAAAVSPADEKRKSLEVHCPGCGATAMCACGTREKLNGLDK